MANDELVVNRIRSASTSTPGRALNQVRNHHFVIDEPTHLGGPGEQITPAEAFLAGVSACGVLLVQSRARETGVRLEQVEATIEGVRHRSDTSVFQRIEIRFRLSGPSQAEAVELVEHYKRR
ncbi:MAG: OsmC family protein [Candidatus Dormibacteraeota bacterium]|nr:OsmC family protein [Candidatus Dormibacteraeota bacterium]